MSVDNKSKKQKYKKKSDSKVNGKSKNLSKKELDTIDPELLEDVEKFANLQSDKVENRDLNILTSIISEYLQSYLIVAYNLEGNRVVIQHTPTLRDQDAIKDFFRTMYYRHENNGYPQPDDEDDDD